MTDSKDESEIDTDDLLFSGVEMMSSAASLLSDLEHRKDSKQLSVVNSPSNRKTARRNLNFDEFPSKFVDFNPSLSTSTSCPVTPSAKSKSCLKKSPTPQKTFQVSFVPAQKNDEDDFDDVQNVFADTSPLVPFEKCEKLRNLFAEVRKEFEKLSRLSDLANNNSSSFATSDSSSSDEIKEEINFVKNLNQQELQEFFEAEIYKRCHGERKIRMLQKQILDLEQRLTISNAVNERRFSFLTDVQTNVDDLILNLTTKDKERNVFCSNLFNQNAKLKDSVEQLVEFSQSLTKKYEILNENFRVTSTKLTESEEIRSKIDSENDLLRRSLKSFEEKNENLNEKCRFLEAEKKKSISREEELTKELMSAEKNLKESAAHVQRFKNELNAEKNFHRSNVDEIERQNQTKLIELSKEFERRSAKFNDDCDQRCRFEIRRMKNEYDASLKLFDEKYLQTIAERDETMKKLKDFERNFEDNLRVMYYSMQQRLTSKYYELVSEFAMPPQRPSSSTGAATFETDGKQLADEFLDRLQKAAPLSTPRHVPAQSNKPPSNLKTSSQNPETIQQFSKIFGHKSQQSGNTPSDPSGKM